MKQLYDELDPNGNVVASGIKLLPGLSLKLGHRWVPHQPSLEALKAEKKSEIEVQRNDACFNSVDVFGYTWQADKRSQDLINSVILLVTSGVVPVPPVWRTLDNVDVPITLDMLKGIAGTIAQQTQNAYSHSWNLKEQVRLASSKQDIDNVRWN